MDEALGSILSTKKTPIIIKQIYIMDEFILPK